MKWFKKTKKTKQNLIMNSIQVVKSLRLEGGVAVEAK